MEGVVHKIYYCDEKLGRCENTIYAQENIENSINSSVAIVLNNIELKLCVAIMKEQRGVLSRRI